MRELTKQERRAVDAWVSIATTILPSLPVISAVGCMSWLVFVVSFFMDEYSELLAISLALWVASMAVLLGSMAIAWGIEQWLKRRGITFVKRGHHD